MQYDDLENAYDERFEYVMKLAIAINPEYDENGNLSYGMWPFFFFNRLTQGAVKPPFRWEAFTDNLDIIGTQEGYGLDPEKFWFVLLFIYDLTIAHTINVADYSRSNYEMLTEIRDYIDTHPQTRIYLSDDEKVSKKRRLEITHPWVIYKIYTLLNAEIAQLEQDENMQDSTFISFEKGYDLQLPPTLQMYYMTQQLKKLFLVLHLPEKRAKYTRQATDVVSYNKMLLISRLLYFCKFTDNESFTVDDTSLKGIIKQCKGYRFKFFNKIYG